MRNEDHIYIAIDLKSFYASVECACRGLDPLTTNLVVADVSRTEKTICLAVSPSLKAYGIPGRARLFEVIQKLKEVNAARLEKAPGRTFSGESVDDRELKEHPELKIGFLAATPQMSLYMKKSTEIYSIYLRYVAPEDIHVYSIDEVFMDVTHYLNTWHVTPREMAKRMIRSVLEETGITATAGIGTNLYLCKVAMDIMAKHVPADEDGVRIAELDERSYREKLWNHKPLTDFWRVGHGYAAKLAEQNITTMGQIARCSIGKPQDYYNEDLLYRLFGVNAELLIDHAWGWEPCTIADIKAYKPENNSLSSGQVLQCPYPYEKAKIVTMEMADAMSLDLVDRRLVTDQLVLTVCYDRGNLDGAAAEQYDLEITTDRYGRKVPKSAHGTVNLKEKTSSSREITEAAAGLFDRIADPRLEVRRIYLETNHVTEENTEKETAGSYTQMDLFTDYEALEQEKKKREEELARERKMQEAVLAIKKKFGKNAVIKGLNLEDGATGRSRNEQIGGHKA